MKTTLNIYSKVLLCSILLLTACSKKDNPPAPPPSEEVDVYAVGYTSKWNNGILQDYAAVYWKNGKAYPLTHGSIETMAHDIYVAKNDVYVAGQERLTNKPIYWKNGQSYIVSNTNMNQQVEAIYVDEGDIYI